MAERRKQAGRLFAAGKMIHAAIARELRVSRQSVSRWYAEWRRGGAGGLARRRPDGSQAEAEREATLAPCE